MSASPTRVDGNPFPASSFPLQEGNRVLESLARQEALRALLAFSDLHARIQNRFAADIAAADVDLFQTERFVLDEVLHLICDRAVAITHADGVLIALEEGPDLMCRAAAGPLAIARGTILPRESEFLQDCLDTARILRCDDCHVDSRVELDLSREIGARSSVVVPLRGQRARLGVLQAFSNVPFAFSDDDVRCFDLFAELILSALKPEDQDRRVNWLAGVVDEVLASQPAVKVASASPLVSVQAKLPSPEPERAASTEPERQELLSQLEPPGEVMGLAASSDSHEPEQKDSAPVFLPAVMSSRRPNPGLSVVLVLLAVAALFSAGVWFGMRQHPTDSQSKLDPASPALQPHPVSATTSDHLLDPAQSNISAYTGADRLSVLPKITGIRHWSTPVGSTVVIDMQDQVPYEVHRLMSPERIYFDLHDTALVSSLEGRSIDIGDAALSRVRVAQPIPGVTRVVLDTRDGSNFSVSMESNPYRLVVELRANDTVMASNRLPNMDSRAASALTPIPARPEDEQLRAKTGRLRIALDAGHGGWDLGTVGRNGLQEKDLVLDVARRLGKLLQARLASEVIFTRTSDTYLPLDERADFANQAQADLFVSVHANYSSTASARGVETYYTNIFTAPGSRDTDKRENEGTAQFAPVSINAGELHEKIEQSRQLAASIQRSLYGVLSATNPGIRDRGVKDSQFVVLTGTTMPAILTEISFVSSPADERNLQSDTYRQQIAEALYKGISRYAAGSHRVKVAEARQNAAITSSK